MDKDKIIARVEKLREVRVDRGATKEEADTAQLLADKLVEKYSITEDDIFGVREEYSRERTGGETWHPFAGPERGPGIGTPIDEFLRAFMVSGIGSFFQEMRDAPENFSSFDKGLFEAIDILLKNWGEAEGASRKSNENENSEADSIDYK